MHPARTALVRSVIFCCALLALVPSAAQAKREGGARAALLEAVDDQRRAHGLPALRTSGSLNRSARSYARYMRRSGYFGHLGSIRASGRFDRLAEAVAMHYGGGARPRQTVRRWMASPSHRAVLLSRSFGFVGAGKSRGSFRGARRATIWVIQLGAR